MLETTESSEPKRMSRWLSAVLLTLLVLLVLIPWRNHQINRLLSRYAEIRLALSNGDQNAAYSIMSPSYRKVYSYDQFTDDTPFVNLDCPRPSARLSWIGRRATLFEYDPPLFDLYAGYAQYWHRINGKWYFTGDTELFRD